jgi:Family of unknown function (DUF5906)
MDDVSGKIKAHDEEVVTVGGVEKRLTTLAELNSHFALLKKPGSATVYISRTDNLPIREDDLKRRLADSVVQIGVKPKGEPIYANAFAFWTGHARRHIYRQIAFTREQAASDTLNLFKGLGVKPRKGRCSLTIAHIREVICSNDSVAGDAMLKLMAWQIQNIGKPSRVIVILKTEKHQAGKGALLGETLLKIYGPSGFIPSATDQVVGRFNDAILGRAYIFLDEVMFSGDRRAADAIKRLSTTTLYGIETKGLPIVQFPVAVNFWAATNHDVAAFIEEADVRYWVVDVSESKIGDPAYFDALMKEVESGGREAFAYHLLNMDVTGFVPLRDTPKNNAAKREMIRRSINPFDARKWIEECCLTRQLIGWEIRTPQEFHDLDLPWPGPSRRNSRADDDRWTQWVTGAEYPFKAFAYAYKEWQKGVKSPVAPIPTPIGSLGEVLGNAGFEAARTGTGARMRVLPDPEVCLANLYNPKPQSAPERHER